MITQRTNCATVVASTLYRCAKKTFLAALFLGGWFMIGVFLKHKDLTYSHQLATAIDPSSGIMPTSWRSPRTRRLAEESNHEPTVTSVLSNLTDTTEGPKGTNVLLMAYQRSGSSFLGEILSIHPKTFYVFEPLIEFSCKRGIIEPNAVADVIRNIFNCEEWTLNSLGPERIAHIKMLRKKGTVQGCVMAPIRVIKTIRLRSPVAQLLITDNNFNVRILHLVRDPRAILNSMKQSNTWQENKKTPSVQCGNMLRDILSAESNFSKEQYMRVRYEDLVEEPLATSIKMFEFLGVPLPHTLATYLATHTEAERFYKIDHNEYFSTLRKSTYDPNKWRTQLSHETIQEIENEPSCVRVMEMLNYPKSDSN